MWGDADWPLLEWRRSEGDAEWPLDGSASSPFLKGRSVPVSERPNRVARHDPLPDPRARKGRKTNTQIPVSWRAGGRATPSNLPPSQPNRLSHRRVCRPPLPFVRAQSCGACRVRGTRNPPPGHPPHAQAFSRTDDPMRAATPPRIRPSRAFPRRSRALHRGESRRQTHPWVSASLCARRRENTAENPLRGPKNCQARRSI